MGPGIGSNRRLSAAKKMPAKRMFERSEVGLAHFLASEDAPV